MIIADFPFQLYDICASYISYDEVRERKYAEIQAKLSFLQQRAAVNNYNIYINIIVIT